jgi:hypothetical protein
MPRFAVFVIGAAIALAQQTKVVVEQTIPAAGVTANSVVVYLPPGPAGSAFAVVAVLDDQLFFLDHAANPPTLRVRTPPALPPQWIYSAEVFQVVAAAQSAFRIAGTPAAITKPQHIRVYRNGLLMALAIDYNVSPDMLTVTFLGEQIPAGSAARPDIVQIVYPSAIAASAAQRGSNTNADPG